MSTFIGAIGKGIGLSVIFATGFAAGVIAGIAIDSDMKHAFSKTGEAMKQEKEETKHD